MHLTMDVPLSPFYSGNLNTGVVATDWKSRLKSRADFETLEKSDLKLVVPVISINGLWGDTEKQFDEQMGILNKFCELHPNWKIVKNPEEAKFEIAKGNKIFIISAEGATYYRDRELYTKLMDKYPISIVTPLHFSDLAHVIGRPAKQLGLFSPIQALLDFFSSNKVEALTPLGDSLFQYLIEKKIWIDLSHASSQVVRYFIQNRPQGYPLMMTHTILGKYYGSDRGIDEGLMQLIAKENGVVGLLPSTEMLGGTPLVEGDCIKGNPFLVQWNELVDTVKLRNAYLGSDTNAPLPGLPAVNANCPVMPDGLRTVADLKTLAQLQDKNSIANFIEQWERVKK
jgi:microsomal dipeptidase-like Zn-dependent dipeptidase